MEKRLCDRDPGMPFTARGLQLTCILGRCEEPRMSDDKSKTRPQDASRVNIHEPYEVEYWCSKFGCTEQELVDAVQKVGVMADDVEKELKRRS